MSVDPQTGGRIVVRGSAIKDPKTPFDLSVVLLRRAREWMNVIEPSVRLQSHHTQEMYLKDRALIEAFLAKYPVSVTGA